MNDQRDYDEELAVERQWREEQEAELAADSKWISRQEYNSFVAYVASLPEDKVCKVCWDLPMADDDEFYIDRAPCEIIDWDDDNMAIKSVEIPASFPAIAAWWDEESKHVEPSDWSYRRAEAGHGE